MAVIVARSIKKKELRSGAAGVAELKIVVKAFYREIGVNIKGDKLPKGTRLLKIYTTTDVGARRIVYLVDVLTGDGFFLMLRSKNDKVGENISIKNQEFRKLLYKYLQLLKDDLLGGNTEVYLLEK